MLSSRAADIHVVQAADGYRLHSRVWPTVDGPRARVVLLHGIISHANWYEASCRHLAGSGYEVHFLDRRGSGLNSADRGDANNFETWLTDVEDYAAQLPGHAPRILAGISWGGKLAAAIAKHRSAPFAGLALITPGIAAQTKASLLQRRALRWADRLGLSHRRVTIPLQDPALFTAVPAWQEYIAADPLTLRQITIRFALADLALDNYVAGAAPHITLPTLLMLAGQDRIIDNPGVQQFFGQLAAADKKQIEYSTAAHTLEFEPDPQPYFSDLTDWVGHIATGSAGLNDRSSKTAD
jgi:alpha-beta hydrolase superfamily lysophospholipase